MADTKRIAYISCLQILGAALVILYHSFHEYPGNYAELPPLLLFQSVRMPLFTFISGFLFMLSWQKPQRYTSTKQFISVKAQRLLVPYIALQTLAFLPRSVMSSYADDAVELSIQTYLQGMLCTNSLTVVFLWFLPMIFVLLSSCYILMRLFRNHINTFLSIGIMASLPLYLLFSGREIPVLGLGRLTDLTLFFLLGMVYARLRTPADRILTHRWIGIICFLLWTGIFAMLDTSSRPTQLLLSFAGLITMLCLAHSLSRLPALWKKLEGYNYYMYLLSWFTCVSSQQLLHHFTDFPWWVYTTLAFASSIIIPSMIGKLLQRYAAESRIARTAMWLLGHNPSKYRNINKQ